MPADCRLSIDRDVNEVLMVSLDNGLWMCLVHMIHSSELTKCVKNWLKNTMLQLIGDLRLEGEKIGVRDTLE